MLTLRIIYTMSDIEKVDISKIMSARVASEKQVKNSVKTVSINKHIYKQIQKQTKQKFCTIH